jgi:hypothetical protein
MRRCLVFWCLLPFVLNAQQSFKKSGGLRAMATFAPVWMPFNENVYYNLNGNFNFYLSENLSIQGEGSYFLNTLKAARHGLLSQHKLLGGLTYHFLANKPFDPFLGFHPGVGVLRFSKPSNLIQVANPPESDVVPLLSVSGGANYYVGSIFHFFAHLRYAAGRSHAAYGALENLSELQLSVGLGLNLGVKVKH